MVPFAQGSDGGGSIRIPASINGLFGIKPTRGRISNAPFGGDVTGLGTNGPLARTVRDAAAMLDAMAGPVLGDPAWAPPLPPGETFLGCGRPRRRAGCGSAATSSRRCRTSSSSRRSRRRSRTPSRLLEDLGHDVEDVPGRAARARRCCRRSSGCGRCPARRCRCPPARVGELRPLTRELRARGLAMSAQAAMEAMIALRLFSRRFLQATAAYDVLLAPVSTMTPRPLGWFDADGDGAADFERQKRYAAFTALFNVTGQPAVSVPLHWTRGRAARRHACSSGRPADEATLLALSAQLEAARPWAHRHPAVVGATTR